MERLVVRHCLKPSLQCLPPNLCLDNQFAYRQDSSTTCALIALLTHITELLKINSCVHVISFDYSKAFDTLSHSHLSQNLAELDLKPNEYNWILNYLTNREHVTKFHGETSSSKVINASIVQGSVLGPTLFNINSASLKPIDAGNRYFKYADDGYLVVPGSNSSTIPLETQHHKKWAAASHLKLNIDKMQEIIFKSKKNLQTVHILPVYKVSAARRFWE